jgi:hypothetical protein
MCNHVNHTKHMTDMGRLSQVGAVSQMFGAEGSDVTSYT